MAARVQELTRQFEADVILTDRLLATLGATFRTAPLPPTRVKGLAEPVRIHALVAP